MKLKWKTIRDGYIKYKKQVKDSAFNGKKINDYIWRSQLVFLDSHNVTRNSKANQNNQKALTQLQTEDSPGEAAWHSPKPEAHTSQESQSPSDMNYQNESRLTKRKAEDDVDKILNYLVNKKEKKYDAVDYLFMSYAETFKTFSSRTQTDMKLELANLFLNAELKEFANAESAQRLTAEAQSGSDSSSSSSDSDNCENSQTDPIGTMDVKIERSSTPDYFEQKF